MLSLWHDMSHSHLHQLKPPDSTTSVSPWGVGGLELDQIHQQVPVMRAALHSESTVRRGHWPLLGGFEPRTFCANQHAAVPPPVSGFTSKHKTPPSFQKPCIYPTKKMDEMEWILSNVELILLSFTLTWNLWACKWRAGTILIFFLLMFHCFNCKHIYTNDEMEFSNVMKCFTPNWSV